VELTSVFDVDPYNDRAVLRGNGDITISNGTLYAINSPRLYISSGTEAGWENVEFTAYGYYSGDYTGTTSSRAGLTLIARTGKDEIMFQKEYYHNADE